MVVKDPFIVRQTPISKVFAIAHPVIDHLLQPPLIFKTQHRILVLEHMINVVYLQKIMLYPLGGYHFPSNNLNHKGTIESKEYQETNQSLTKELPTRMKTVQ